MRLFSKISTIPIYTKKKNTTYIKKKEELKKEITELIAGLRNLVSDKELLKWARDNHPMYKEKMQLVKEIESRYSELEGLK